MLPNILYFAVCWSIGGGNMSRKFMCVLIIAIMSMCSLFNSVFGNDEETAGPIPIELVTLCYQATALHHNTEKFILPTYPEEHRLVATLRGPHDSDLFGFISETSTRIFIVFRGTQTGRDAKRDFNCIKVPFHLVPGAGEVHQGFLNTYTKLGHGRLLSLRDFILKTISGMDPTKKLYITGHSMGGGVATLCALDVAVNSSLFKQPILYTFASPRVGNKAFVEKFNSTIRTSVRIKNQYDLVPSTPLKSMGFQHVKGGVSIRVKTNSIENHHRIVTAYLPGIMANFTNFISDLLHFNPEGLIPPIKKIPLVKPGWKEQKKAERD